MPAILIIVIVMAGMMYFTSRKQKQAAKERQNQMNSLTKGDEIVTIGGLYGIVDEVNPGEQKIVLDIDGVYLTFELSAVKRVISKVGDIPSEVGLVKDQSVKVTSPTEESAIESN